MELFDTHCHLADPKLYPDYKKIIARAREAGVTRIITVGYDDDTNRLSIEVASEFEEIWAAVGIHPNEDYDKEMILPIKDKVVAIGETGLDYYRDNTDKKTQIERFREHINIAKMHNLPIIIHTRKAFHDIIPIIEEMDIHNGVFHCFTGDPVDARRIVDLGFCISFSGLLTYGSSKLAKVLISLPRDRVLFETDSPYLSPVRGKINEPANVKLVVEYAANILKTQVDDLAWISTENGRKLFGV